MASRQQHHAGIGTTPDAGILRRAIAASAMGNAVEWFDYGVYAYVAVYIGHAFFPSEDPTTSTLSSLAVFAISFLIRPIGGLVWGPLGDRLGRRAILATTIILMSIATFAVGLLPGYATIGIWAPIGLIILRMIQGFSTGGEYGGAATFMAEYAPDDRRGFCGSFLEFGTIGGFILGALLVLVIQTIIGETAMAAWGWRLPFFVAGPMGLIGLYLRSKLEDTPVFRELEAAGETEHDTSTEFRDLMHYWRPMVLLMALIPFGGALSDRVGRKPLWWASIVGLFVMAIPMYSLMAHGFGAAIIGFAVLGLLYVPQLSTISAMFPAMFPTHVRYAGFAIAYNVSTSLFGGTAPAANEWLISLTGNDLVPAYYMMASCIVGAIALAFVPETAGASIRGREIPGLAGPLRPQTA